MLRFLISIGLIAYVIYKIGNFFFKAGAMSQQRHSPPPTSHTSKSYKGNHSDSVKGGEYVDYEEVQ